MASDSHLSVDKRALDDLRATAHQARQDLAGLHKKHETLLVELEDAEERLEQLSVEQEDTRSALEEARREASRVAELASTVESLTHEVADARSATTQMADDLAEESRRANDLARNAAELTEALRAAQVEYWQVAEQLRERRLVLDRTEHSLQQRIAHVEQLREQLDRITGSRAWRLISLYRRFVNRLRRRTP